MYCEQITLYDHHNEEADRLWRECVKDEKGEDAANALICKQDGDEWMSVEE